MLSIYACQRLALLVGDTLAFLVHCSTSRAVFLDFFYTLCCLCRIVPFLDGLYGKMLCFLVRSAFPEFFDPMVSDFYAAPPVLQPFAAFESIDDRLELLLVRGHLYPQ